MFIMAPLYQDFYVLYKAISCWNPPDPVFLHKKVVSIYLPISTSYNVITIHQLYSHTGEGLGDALSFS